MALGIEKHVSGGITTLVLTGDLDTATAGQLEATVKDIIAGDQPGITYVSSFGLRVIVYTSKAMRAHKDRFAMHSIQQDVMEILSISGLSGLLKVVETQEAAVELMEV